MGLIIELDRRKKTKPQVMILCDERESTSFRSGVCDIGGFATAVDFRYIGLFRDSEVLGPLLRVGAESRTEYFDSVRRSLPERRWHFGNKGWCARPSSACSGNGCRCGAARVGRGASRTAAGRSLGSWPSLHPVDTVDVERAWDHRVAVHGPVVYLLPIQLCRQNCSVIEEHGLMLRPNGPLQPSSGTGPSGETATTASATRG